MKICENPNRVILPIRNEADKGTGESNPRLELSQLLNEKDKITKLIHGKVKAILAREYPAAMDEGKETILRINEQLA